MKNEIKHDLNNTIVRIKSIIELIEDNDPSFTLDELLTAGDKSIEQMTLKWKEYKRVIKEESPSPPH